MKNFLLAAMAAAALTSFQAKADEGMWLINDINKALEKKMQERGLKLGANEIYDADAPGATLSDAVVSLGFYCTGSMISEEGLLITNHHCAYADVYAVSTPEHNYLEDGFWATERSKEIPIPGKQVFFLKKVIDVTDEAKDLAMQERKAGRPAGQRRISFLLEKKYKNDTGLEASLSSMWAGEKYYMALYKVYTDLRLVAAPPVSISAFGGDVDNWGWPQQKGDFALYRLYADASGEPAEYSPSNVAYKPEKTLKISTKGYKPGDFTMVIGYPGRTNRYSSGAEVKFMENVDLPVTTSLRGKQAQIIKGWMDRDPEVRLKYSDNFFNLSNVTGEQLGERQCLKRFGVLREKDLKDEELRAWISDSPVRVARWGNLLSDMDNEHSLTDSVERQKGIFRETLFRGLIISRTLMRLRNSHLPKQKEAGVIQAGLDETDPRVEKDLLRFAVEEFYKGIDTVFMGSYQKSLLKKYGTDYKAITDTLWDNSIASSPERMKAYSGKEELNSDPLCKWLWEMDMNNFNNHRGELSHRNRIIELQREYKQALYEMNLDKGRPQYPDANSTMRISYGRVSSLEPRDGVILSWRSTTTGILEKYDPQDHDFTLLPRQKALLEAGDWGRFADHTGLMHVDFLSDNDITGGNSGSPVLNADGELIGLAFDGNKESLASEVSYTPLYNKCVNVDIRYVLWLLSKYDMGYILSEIGI